MRSLNAYRQVFANPPLARLMFGEFVSSIGDWLYLVALLVVVYEANPDPVVLGFVGAARVVPYILLSVPAGMAADRFDRRLILFVTDLGRGLIMLVLTGLVLLPEPPIVLIVAFSLLAACLSAFFSPAIGSLIPSLATDERQLGPANAAWSSLDNLAFVIGPAVSGILIAVGGIPAAFALNAVSFGVVAAVLWTLPKTARATAGAVPDTAGATPAAGGMGVAIRPILRPLLGLGLIDLVDGFVTGGLTILTVFIAVEILSAGAEATGWLNAAIGVGGLIGAVLAGPLTLWRRLEYPLLVGGVMLGVGLVLVGQSQVLVLALLALVVATGGMLLLEVVATTIFQRTVPDAIRGRSIGAMDTLSTASYSLGSFVAPVLASAIGAGPVLLGFGVAMAVATVAGFLLVGRSNRDPDLDADAPRFARLPFLAGLSPASLENAARHLVRVPVASGDVIVRQGDPADRFYHILDGAFAVTQADFPDGPVHELRTLGPDDVFGEIGLLRQVPRTATVSATTDGTLLALDGDRFLELVGSGPGLTSRLLDIHRGGGADAGPR